MASKITTMKLPCLFAWLQIAQRRAKLWEIRLQMQPECAKAQKFFAYWKQKQETLYAEIERRADLLDIEVLMYLIHSCSIFFFNQKQYE